MWLKEDDWRTCRTGKHVRLRDPSRFSPYADDESLEPHCSLGASGSRSSLRRSSLWVKDTLLLQSNLSDGPMWLLSIVSHRIQHSSSKVLVLIIPEQLVCPCSLAFSSATKYGIKPF